MTQRPPRTLSQLLDVVDRAAAAPRVSVRDLVQEFGERSITPFILLTALLLVSPLSGIPTVPTFGALIIVTLAAQALLGRPHVWLPDLVLRRAVSGKRLRSAIGWMRNPCAFLDRHAHKRLTWLTRGPMRVVNLALCLLIPLTWPPLELLPMVTSVSAATVALLAFGLFQRDGLFVLLGYAMLAAAGGLLFWLWP